MITTFKDVRLYFEGFALDDDILAMFQIKEVIEYAKKLELTTLLHNSITYIDLIYL